MLFPIIIIILFAMVAIWISKSIRSLGRKDYLKMEPVPGDPIELDIDIDSTSMVTALRTCAKAFEDFGKVMGGMRPLVLDMEEVPPPKEPEPIVETKKSSVRRIRM